MGEQILHIASLNVCGLRDSQKRLRLMQWIKQQNVDIILTQETHFTPDITSQINFDFSNMNSYHAFGSNLSRGCSILISKRTQVNIIDTIVDNNGRYVLINLQIWDNCYTLVNIYAPNDKVSRNQFYNEVNTLIEQSSQGIILIGGDYNDVLTDKDRVFKITKLKQSVSKPVDSLNSLMQDYNLTDV